MIPANPLPWFPAPGDSVSIDGHEFDSAALAFAIVDHPDEIAEREAIRWASYAAYLKANRPGADR